LEQVTLSMAVGVLAFFLGMFGGGILGLYGSAFAVALPLVMLAASAPSSFLYVRRAARVFRAARRRPRVPAPITWLPIALYGLAGIGMIYFIILTPENVSYDARWYHIGLAEQYVAEGAVRASAEGSFLAALPHLSSFLYAWALMVPGLPYFDHIELCAHIELAVFLFTLAGIPVAVRALLPRTRAAVAWAAIFLFPEIFLYDSTLGASADHITAFWGVPIWITMWRALEKLEPRRCALFAAMLTGAMLTKYQGAEIVAGPVVVSLARVAWLAGLAIFGRFEPRSNLWRAPVVAVVTCAVLFAPHWAKNWVFYGDPLYPNLSEHLHVHPWTLDSAHRVQWDRNLMWTPHGTFAEKIHETLRRGVLMFSFEPQDYPFHGDWPEFGSLFSLLIFALPFLRKSGRVMVLSACALLGVGVWYWMHHQDRTLQILVPWMAACVAATLILVWRTGWLGRLAAIPLVFAQIVWGGDVYFFPAHAMIGQSPIKTVTDLMSSYFRKDSRRLIPFGAWYDIGSVLPKGSKVLLHHSHVHLGLRAATVSDFEVWQGGLSYGRLGSPRAIYDYLRHSGVTHIVLAANPGDDTLAGDLPFDQFAKFYAIDSKPFGALTLLTMPPGPPSGPFNDKVVVHACGASLYADGVYRVSDLVVFDDVPGPRPAPEAPFDARGALAAGAGFVVQRPACGASVASTGAGYQLIGTRGELQLWARPPQ
jgi:hypothetical protein